MSKRIQVYEGDGVLHERSKAVLRSRGILNLTVKGCKEDMWHDGHTDVTPRYETMIRQIMLEEPDTLTKGKLIALSHALQHEPDQLDRGAINFDSIFVNGSSGVSSTDQVYGFYKRERICLLKIFDLEQRITSILIQQIPKDVG